MMTSGLELTPFEQVLKRFQAGEMIILLDADDRENEGDLVVAAHAVTARQLGFMMHLARGLICISLSTETAARLNLPLQTIENGSPFQTPFGVSVDLVGLGELGITAAGRAATIRALADKESTSAQFTSPGAVFPLIANSRGVLARQGQTEGSYDLARIVGCSPAAVVCEILNSDGTMARSAQLQAFALTHGLAITTIAEIIRHRVQNEVLLREVARSELETEHGKAQVVVFEDDVDGKEHLALIYGDPRTAGSAGVLSRIHSECLTGDVFTSRRCDCGPQLSGAIKMMVAAGSGVLLYLRQEGRGIGLGNKLRAYALQDQGHDTVEANLELGFAADGRDFAVAAKILTSLGVDKVKLITNNPRKVAAIEQMGVQVLARIPIIVPEDPYSKTYLATKKAKLGHML